MSTEGLNRRTFLKATLAGAVLGACRQEGDRSPDGHAPTPPEKTGKKVVVVGFDGVDPRLMERWMQSGDLPNLAKLASDGMLLPLGSTSPPNSPVAWSTFATGRDPSEHGVFGFLRRDPGTYLPGTAPYTIRAPRFGPEGVSPARAVSHRRGAAWWDRLDRAGVRTCLLFVPYAFPPPELRHGRVLCGLGAPDARFTNSSFTLYTSEPGDSDSVAGGRIVRLALTGSKIETRLEGARGPNKKYLSVPLQLELDRKAGTVAISLGDRREKLAEGKRSGWFPLEFRAAGFALAGRVRFHLLEVRDELKIYASPIQLDPGQKMLPLGAPAGWLVKAIENHSLPTVGWVHDTSAVNAGALPKDVFLGAVLDTMQARAGLLIEEIRAGHAQVLTAVFTGTDRAAHIFYKDLERPDGGPLRQVYRTMDRIVGQVRRRLSPGTRLIIMSDHGFHAFDRMLHVNTWLEAQGLLARSRPDGKVRFLRGIDWSTTRAYSIGNGQVYANLEGRESSGSVTPGPEREALLASIRKNLLALKDPKTGTKPVRAIYPVADKAAADLRDRAPDLQIAFAPGWRSSWETSLGGAPAGDFIAPNPKAWCGDHAASDVTETPGVLLADSKPTRTDPDLKDLAPSLLALAGVEPDGPGRPLWT